MVRITTRVREKILFSHYVYKTFALSLHQNKKADDQNFSYF